MRHFLDISDLSRAELERILEESARRKQARAGWPKAMADEDAPLAGHALALIFEKPSTRTRVSFDVAMRQLGGQSLVFNAGDLQLGKGETIEDTAKVFSRMVDALMVRTHGHDNVLKLAEYGSIPVINGLTDLSHPCQIVADLLTLQEHKGKLEGLRVAWLGDCANVTRSWIEAAALLGIEMRIGAPKGYQPEQDVLEWAKAHGGDILVTEDPVEAVEGADCVMTDTWVSMHHPAEERDKRIKDLMPYQVTAALMSKAKPDAIFMHCLPAYRGEEVTAEVIDGPQSVVFDEAENRLHGQKGVLLYCFERI
jgi:ornithine carbamoyltransferase